MNKKVIYTCLVGGYDNLLQPLVVDPTFDYICFSNDMSENKIGVWEIRPIPYLNKDKARLSRYVKILPHVVLQDYTYSVWLDANIQICGSQFYQIIDEKINENGLIYHVNHVIPFCDCIYEEIKYAYLCGRVGLLTALVQFRHLKSVGFPSHWGLFENNLILRKHNDASVRIISEAWWREYLSFSKRDQFSLMYVYWANKARPALLFDKDHNTRNVDFLKWTEHVSQANNNLWRRINMHLRPILSRTFSVLE